MTSTQKTSLVRGIVAATVAAIMLCGCQIAKRAEPPMATRAFHSKPAEESATISHSPGVLATDTQSAIVLLDNSINREVLVKVKDMLGNCVGRWVMDKEVYGNSVLLVPGYAPMGEAPDHPRSHFIYTQKFIPTAARR